ncbi:hypothetical protein V2J09_009026 [Rumex salicifolius]
MSMLLVDFSNAFNLIDRSTMLSEVRRCCPSLSPWVEFCYACPRGYTMMKLVCYHVKVFNKVTLGTFVVCAYLTSTWSSNQRRLQPGLHGFVSDALHLIIKEGPSMGLYLNVEKTEIFWPNPDLRSNDPMLFSQKMARPLDRVNLLGGSVSLDIDFCSRLIEDRVSKTVSLMEVVAGLNRGFFFCIFVWV